MAVPMIMYRCKKCGCGQRREAKGGRPHPAPCSKGGSHVWVIESRD
jgi:hypothetical protein